MTSFENEILQKLLLMKENELKECGDFTKGLIEQISNIRLTLKSLEERKHKE